MSAYRRSNMTRTPRTALRLFRPPSTPTALVLSRVNATAAHGSASPSASPAHVCTCEHASNARAQRKWTSTELPLTPNKKALSTSPSLSTRKTDRLLAIEVRVAFRVRREPWSSLDVLDQPTAS
jgi:hypothetical protein